MNTKFKPGEIVWVGDLHFSEKCEVVEYHKGGKYSVRRLNGKIVKVETKFIRHDKK